MVEMVEMTKKMLFLASYRFPGSSVEPQEIVLVLADETLKKGLSISMGIPEGHSISAALNEVTLPRPLAHDVMIDVVKKLEGQVVSIQIYDVKTVQIPFGERMLVTEAFLARINLVNAEGEEIPLEARPSDAVALALRAKTPIYVAPKLLEETSDEDFEETTRRQYVRRQLAELEDEEVEKFKI